jgi:hypothetical protein
MDRSAPQWWITVYREGMPSEKTRIGIDLAAKVTALSFEDNDQKADKLVLTVENFDLAFLDSPVFAHGNTVQVSFGYDGAMSPARSTKVTKVTGGVSLKVECLGGEFQMHKETKVRTFERQKRSDIARTIAQEYGFGPSAQDIEDTAVIIGHVSQSSLTDLAFLWEMARKEGFVFFIDEAGFHFRRRNLGQAPLKTLTYYVGSEGSILSFDITSDITAKPASVTLVGMDVLKGNAFKVTADNMTQGDRPVLGAISAIVDPSTASESLQTGFASAVTRTTGASTKEDAQRQANGAFLANALAGVEMTVVCVGDPELRAKTIVRVEGIGAKFSGPFYVVSATHAIGTGYRTTLKLKRDGTNKSLASGAPPTNAGQTNDQKPGDPNGTREVKVTGADGQERTEYH